MRDDDSIFVLRNGGRLGPFTSEELLVEVDEGRLDYEDICLRGDAGECQRICEILDWEEEQQDVRDQTGDESDVDEDQEEPGTAVALEEENPESHEVPEPESEPDSNLPPSDPGLILYAGHQSLVSFPGSLFLIAAGLGGGLWFRDVSGWILFSGLTLALLAAAYIMVERTSRLYIITPKRVEIEKGLFAKSSNEVRIADIRTINVVRTGFLGMIGVGRVEFASSGGKDVEVAFDDVWAARRIKALVRRLQDANG